MSADVVVTIEPTGQVREVKVGRERATRYEYRVDFYRGARTLDLPLFVWLADDEAAREYANEQADEIFEQVRAREDRAARKITVTR